MKVFKYPLKVAGSDRQVIDLPKGAKVLSAQMQYGDPYLWALVDPEAPNHPLGVWIFGTGWRMDNAQALEFVDTFQMDGGSLVYHVFVEAAQ